MPPLDGHPAGESVEGRPPLPMPNNEGLGYESRVGLEYRLRPLDQSRWYGLEPGYSPVGGSTSGATGALAAPLSSTSTNSVLSVRLRSRRRKVRI